MRSIFAIPLVLASVACNAQPSSNTASATAAAADAITLKASDGVTVYGRYYKAERPKALILLFHQAGSSKDEYATIAPRLAAAGYSALAIDQRAGDELFGRNETAEPFGRKPDYLEALPDLKAALDWGRKQKLPIVLWGSSYSSSLIFPLAAEEPQDVVALLSFSPGEYFDSDKQMIRRAAAQVKVPVFLASTKEEGSDADPVMAALPKNPASVRFVPDHGVHGSSTLIPARNAEGAEANWRAVMAFLNRVTAAK